MSGRASTTPKTSRASRSRSRSRGRSSKSQSKSRSRSRSRGRGRPKKTYEKKEEKKIETPKESPAPSTTGPPVRRRTRSNSRPRELPRETPTRQSSRLQEKANKDECHVDGNSTTPKKDILLPPVTTSKKKTSYEFGGPIGAFLMIFALPAVLFGINLMCNKTSCSLRLPVVPRDLASYYSRDAVFIVLGWFVFQALLAMVPIGPIVSGQPLAKGNRLEYNCNGFPAFIVSMSTLVVFVYKGVDVTICNRLFMQLAAASAVFSLVLSLVLYLHSRTVAKSQLSPHGATGCVVYDFFMGRELNPRFGPLDLKFFCELRPGLIGWAALNWIFVYEGYATGKFTPALALVAICQTVYVLDALFFEDSILSTMDITTEGFGFMLAFGDLAWVPFLYCLQTRYLLMFPQVWSSPALMCFSLLNMLGYLVFRSSNSQKDKFRKDPNNPVFATLETIPTPSGKKLLASGWWGLVRHPNYLGDLIMALAWSLPCGFASPVPYFYPIYFFILLAHRAIRDSAACKLKHKAAWDRYCQRVPNMIIPKVF
ncbi:hypothetical protein CAPTEDRAFT_167905 [Capitella teleta]|uniref:Delta(14)-sterol reductase n=1 Tax=Capitella teleta TaxID=283909 RepID=R7U448_CAPTE|nr:hypothetical protein CAPTEDRAFT_167905 [Capitella teleta]|eukprot:ELU01125.1 hypothetical protein CAPTEDRAFT_167905 [Capitella teleta]